MSFLSNLINHLRSWDPIGPVPALPNTLPPPPPVPVKLTVPKPWPDPPEVLCFVKGVAKSLREDPADTWNRGHISSLYPPGLWQDCLQHHALDVTIWMRWSIFKNADKGHPPGCTAIREVYVNHPVSPAEKALIAQALEVNPRHRFRDHLADICATQEKAKRTTDHFTRLGCPDQA